MLAQQENLKLEKQCLLARLKALEEELTVAKAAREAPKEAQNTAILESKRKGFALLWQEAEQEGPQRRFFKYNTDLFSG